jgi:hypothetical protein
VKLSLSTDGWPGREEYAVETRCVGVVIDLYCATRRDWSFAAAEAEGEGENDSDKGEDVCGRYDAEEVGVHGS